MGPVYSVNINDNELSSSSSSSMILTNVPLGTKRPADSNRPQSPLPHTLEPRVDECSFEVQSTVLG